ncbi:CUB and zona pellucida-like domain-containing protein 1 [Ambystoma mexicanum]|uniref:CUB and zona pellucida-like domain-containing protein 1 n=1 Tax=Ambystoma mexicanum TaxID=8296 RepID=UPI0037E9BD6E
MPSVGFQPNSDCSQENITVYDGDSSSAPSLGGACKDSRGPAIFESSSSSLTFQIFTDSAAFARSIFAFFYYVSPEDESQQCGGTLTGPSGAFSSPNYPAFHPDFTFCVWHITVKPGARIHIVFSEIFLEIDQQCRFDFLALYDGPSTSSRLIEDVCGRTTREYESSSNSLTVVLSTDYANSYRGFSAKYTAENTNSFTLSCASDFMSVVIKQSYLQWLGYSVKDLALLDPSCRTNTSNPVEFQVPFSSCGTLKQVTDDHAVIYTNVITASPAGSLITRHKTLQIVVKCEMEYNSTVEIMYVTEDDIIQLESSGGRYDVSIAFFESDKFTHPVSDSPYYVDLNQTLFTQIALRSSDPELVVFVDSCIASPKIDFGAPVYDLIRSGCEKDDTCHVYPLHASHARFQFSAFKFLKELSSIYLQCRVVVCDRNDSESRCTKGCVSRHKRDLSSQSHTVNAVVGPIRLKSNHNAMGRSDSFNADLPDSSAGSQGSSVFLIALVVLAVNSMILVLVALKSYRNKQSGYRYQKLPGL